MIKITRYGDIFIKLKPITARIIKTILTKNCESFYLMLILRINKKKIIEFMNIQSFTSKLLESAVDEFSKLPGIGKKTALRLVLHLLNQEKEDVTHFGETIIKLRNEIKHCKSCNTISDTDICNICNDKSRDESVICVVENARDVMSIENTHQFNGIYHVLGGIISPMDGI